MTATTHGTWWVGVTPEEFYRIVEERRLSNAAKYGSDGVINFATAEPPYADRRRARAARLRNKARVELAGW